MASSIIFVYDVFPEIPTVIHSHSTRQKLIPSVRNRIIMRDVWPGFTMSDTSIYSPTARSSGSCWRPSCPSLGQRSQFRGGGDLRQVLYNRALQRDRKRSALKSATERFRSIHLYPAGVPVYRTPVHGASGAVLPDQFLYGLCEVRQQDPEAAADLPDRTLQWRKTMDGANEP